jgi:hypothetical protein
MKTTNLFNWPFLKVTKVEERFEITNSYKSDGTDGYEKGQTVEEKRSKGWFVELDGVRLAFHVGDNKPSTEVGDSALLSLQTWKEPSNDAKGRGTG